MIINKKQVTSSASLGCRSFHHQDGSWLQGTSCPVKKGIRLFQGSHFRAKAMCLANNVLSQQNSAVSVTVRVMKSPGLSRL